MRLTKLKVEGLIAQFSIVIVEKQFVYEDRILYGPTEKDWYRPMFIYLRNDILKDKYHFPCINFTESYWNSATQLKFYNESSKNYVSQLSLTRCFETVPTLIDVSFNREDKYEDVDFEMDDNHYYFLCRQLYDVNRVYDLPASFSINDLKFVQTECNINNGMYIHNSYIPFYNGVKLEPIEYKDKYMLTGKVIR